MTKKMKKEKSIRKLLSAFESLEERQLLTLLGVAPGYPNIYVYGSDPSTAPINTTYNAGGVLSFTANATPFDYFELTPTGVAKKLISSATTFPKQFQLNIQVDHNGNVVGGVPGNDLEIDGKVNSPSLGLIDGVLLTGEISQFGWEYTNSDVNKFDFRFTVTGGDLAPLYANKDIGVSFVSEGSTFTGSFEVSFTGNTKGNVGPIDQIPASIGDYVWEDTNADGVQNDGNTGINNVTVNLLNSSGTVIDTQLTHTNPTTSQPGYYLFDNLIPGTYSVEFVKPGGYIPTAADQGNDALDSDADVSTGKTGSYTLASGDSNLTVDAGFYKLASLGDYVWHDADANGIQDTGEVGIDGATVKLLDSGGNTLSTATTSGGGYYLFSGLTPGVAYKVQFLMPAGYNFASDFQQGSDTAKDSDGQLSNAVTLASGEYNPTIDSGYYKSIPGPIPGLISGHKYLDVTGNGMSADDKANPLSGVTIKLYKDVNGDNKLTSADGAAIATDTTDANGYYEFTGLEAGKYLVQEVVPTGYIRTYPTYNDYWATSIADGGVSADNDFVNAEKCCKELLSGIYFVVSGSSGTKTVSSLVGNTHQGDTVTAYFTVNSSTPHAYSLVSYTAPENYFVAEHASLQRIYDAATGSFSSGNYSLTVTIPNCYYQIDFVCGYPIDILGPANSNIFYSPQNRLFSYDNSGTTGCCTNNSIITGHVYNDADKDGVFDFGDSGISGATVTLLKLSTTNTWVSVKTAKTGTNGFYSFTGLSAGTYKVSETQPSGYIDSKDNLGSLGGSDAVNDELSGIILTSASTGSNYNFGEIKQASASISGTVFLDSDKDGCFETGESGISNVTIQLLDSSGVVVATDTTDSSGAWSFSNITPGKYSVVEIQPTGYTDGADKVGSLGGGTATNDKFSDITFKAGDAGVNYLFAEFLTCNTSPVGCNDAAGPSYWAGCNGQKLLTYINGNSCSTKLGNWMAITFPKLFSSYSGKTNSYIASAFKTINNSNQLMAQILAVVFSVYVTDTDYAGTTASSYGFKISSTGVGAKLFNVQWNGAAFGVANNVSITVLQALNAINNSANYGSPYGGNSSLCNTALNGLTIISNAGNKWW